MNSSNNCATVVFKRFLCDYCKCIFIADKHSYEVVKYDEYENTYQCKCPVCKRVATQVLGTVIKNVTFEKPKK